MFHYSFVPVGLDLLLFRGVHLGGDELFQSASLAIGSVRW